MNIEVYGDEKDNENAVLGALYAIKAARKELDLQIVQIIGEATPSALMSQIGLYDVLLEEIRTIYACLGGARAQRGHISHRRTVARCSRSGRYLALPHIEGRQNRRGGLRQEMRWQHRLPSGGGS